jgi:ribosome-binding protein aMBF1 (putative translation factor)
MSSLILAMSIGCTHFVLASEGRNWDPVASDKLIKLPANIIEKRIQQDFEASPMALHLVELEQHMQDKLSQLKSLGELIVDSEGDDLIKQRFELVQQKSEYLDLMQEAQGLRQNALAKKQQLYETVLGKLRNKNGRISKDEVYQLKQKQAQALERMQNVMAQVDSSMMHKGLDQRSPYADEFAINLAKVEALKNAISEHKANASPTLGDVEVTSEEYVRRLLMQASTEQSLLDQESLMFSYMAKLVALDAQALEYEISYGDEDTQLTQRNRTKPADVADLFL